jgi:hypothetical protein
VKEGFEGARPESGSNSEDEEDEFEDAKTDLDYEDFTVSAPPQHRYCRYRYRVQVTGNYQICDISLPIKCFTFLHCFSTGISFPVLMKCPLKRITASSNGYRK